MLVALGMKIMRGENRKPFDNEVREIQVIYDEMLS